MRFRKLLLCMFAGIALTSFANVYTYAAEEDNIVTEDTTVKDTTIDTTAANAVVTNNIEVVNGTTGMDTTITDNQSTEAVTSGVSAEVNSESASTDTQTAEDKKAEEEKVAKEAAEKEAAEAKKAAVEKAEAEKAEAKKAAAKKAAAKRKAEAAKRAEEEKYSKNDLRLLSALIYCEANGESYNGKLAVGIVVMNRKRAGAFPDTVKSVVYQKYQFGPASNGALNNALDQYDNGKFTSSSKKECIKAAKAALSGTTSITVKGAKKNFTKYKYFSGNLRGNTFTLGNHEFK